MLVGLAGDVGVQPTGASFTFEMLCVRQKALVWVSHFGGVADSGCATLRDTTEASLVPMCPFPFSDHLFVLRATTRVSSSGQK